MTAECLVDAGPTAAATPSAALPLAHATHTGRPPVILIGMHRSGTSMLCRLLEQLGVFMGWQKQGDHEALFFVKLNNWLLTQSGARWDQPLPIKHLVADTAVREVAVDYLDVRLGSLQNLSYLGKKRARYGNIGSIKEPWGWKDPRSTFTLPFWLDVFPDAKVVHILRHGVDVAESLRARDAELLTERVDRYKRLRATYRFRAKQIGFRTSLRFGSLDEGMSLWSEYGDQAHRHVESLGDQAFELRFEDLIAAPVRHLLDIARFCGVDGVTEERVQAVAGHINPDRSYAHRNDPELAAFAAKHADTLARLGY
jgi:hypothetical protein